ncbi:MAG TPA: hypothetical protein VN445_01325 [Rectinemataceae bacterium]|nr:hypothetical protein [Rectinemataceae bacterium]
MSAYREDDAALTQALAMEGRVLVEGGSVFGSGGRAFIRLNISCQPS